MPNYQHLYTLLFNAITDALRQMDAQNPAAAKLLLIIAQQQAENLYISDEENADTPIRTTD